MKTLLVMAMAGGAVLILPPRRALAVITPKSSRALGRTSQPTDAESECLAVLDGLVVLLRAGVPAESAISMAIKDLPGALVGDRSGWSLLAETASVGGDVPAIWQTLGRQWQCPTFADVASAWAMCSRYGCPLADAMATAAAGIRATRRHRSVVEAAVAGARATTTVLALLPVLGAALGVALGADMMGTYAGASGFVTLWPGLGLMWLGRRWINAVMRKVLAVAEGPRT